MECPHCGKEIDEVVFVVTEHNSYSYRGDGSACWEYLGNGDYEVDKVVCEHCGETLEGLDSFDAVDAAMQGETE